MILDPLLDVFRGKAVTIPPMDGALRPNTALDEAAVLAECPAPDNLCFDGARVLFSSDHEILALPESASAKLPVLAEFDADIAALAASPGGRVAVALASGRLLLRDGTAAPTEVPRAGAPACPTALAFAGEDTLYVCHGSATHGPEDWVVDLMERNASGSVWRVDLAGGRTDCLARDLAFPNGILVDRDGGRLIVSESWRHRLIAIPLAGGDPRPLLAKLPGYPARLAASADGGAWLALFAPRNRLIEFVLLEETYRADMMREVPRDYWIAPALSSGRSFLEPLQCGGVKTMGIHKPWSPSRSYGLVARLDRAMQPVASFHSRANGSRHGVTSVLERDGRLIATAKGGDAILGIALGRAGEA
jgi:Strictosidine synthase